MHKERLVGIAGREREGEDAPAADDLVLEVEPGRLAHRLDDLQHAHALPAPEVVRLVARVRRAVVEDLRLGRERVQREQVALGQIEHVQVVAHAGAVAGAQMSIRVWLRSAG